VPDEVKLVPVTTALDIPFDIDEICNYVADGGTLAKFCRDRKMPYGDVRRFVKDNKYNLDKLEDAEEARDEWAKQMICDMVMEIARFDPRSVLDADGNVLPMQKWPPEARVAVSEIEVLPGTSAIKVKFTPRLKAIDTIGKTLGMYATKLKVEANKTIADLIMAANNQKDD